MNVELLAPAATIGAAAIAALVGLLSVILSKESKTSDFRQAWIDSLRAEIAILISHLLQVLRLQRRDDATEKQQERIDDLILSANEALFLVRLRLNEKECSSNRLLRCLENIEDASDEVELPNERILELENELIASSKAILKEEWDRVREGELTYQIAKWGLTITLFGVILSALLWFWFTL